MFQMLIKALPMGLCRHLIGEKSLAGIFGGTFNMQS